jgi:SAM-dependent methyltransferase
VIALASTCPLCAGAGAPICFDESSGKEYSHCRRCDLRFLRPSDRLSLAEERVHYSHHNNDVMDTRYQAFVSPLIDAIKARVRPGSSGLDFGSGPGPVLSKMMRSDGYEVELYDPIFCADERALERTYDFVAMSEVAEHLFDPLFEFKKLHALLKPGGILAVMTLFAPEDAAFAQWYYRRDPTHVVFYSERSFAWIKDNVGFSSVETDSRRVAVLTK